VLEESINVYTHARAHTHKHTHARAHSNLLFKGCIFLPVHECGLSVLYSIAVLVGWIEAIIHELIVSVLWLKKVEIDCVRNSTLTRTRTCSVSRGCRCSQVVLLPLLDR
jgi:hypothetical protein